MKILKDLFSYSLLKSYKPEAVPERIPITNSSNITSGNFEEPLKKAHSRNVNTYFQNGDNKDIQWNSGLGFKVFCFNIQ